MTDQCPECKSKKIHMVGWDIYPTDDMDVIEEEQYKCYDCKIFFFQGISMKDSTLPIRVHRPDPIEIQDI